MTTVFLSGSRKISRLNDEIRQRLDNMVEKKLDIITGDANGADKAMQSYLAELHYPHVTVFHVGAAPRNNIGDWPTRKVETDKRLSGRHFYAQKDKEMSGLAEFGLVLWDGNSSGSVQNMIWLISGGKTVVLYHSPQKRFYSFKTEEDLIQILSQSDDDVLNDIDRRIGLPKELSKTGRQQRSLL